MVSNLPLRFIRPSASVFKGSPAHVSTLSSPAAQAGIRPVPHDDHLEQQPPVASPVAFRPPASASWTSCPAEGFRPSYDRPTGPTRPGPRRGFHVPRTRDTAGEGAPYTPRPAVFPRPALTPRSPLAAPTSGQALSPRYSSRLPGLEITRHHQGFTHVHPPDLPLARLLPQTEQGPLGFYPGLRTPTDKTRRRTPGRGSILNTDRELRTRHDRPPICEFTRYARPRVARENFLCCYRGAREFPMAPLRLRRSTTSSRAADSANRHAAIAGAACVARRGPRWSTGLARPCHGRCRAWSFAGSFPSGSWAALERRQPA